MSTLDGARATEHPTGRPCGWSTNVRNVVHERVFFLTNGAIISIIFCLIFDVRPLILVIWTCFQDKSYVVEGHSHLVRRDKR